MGSTYTGGVKYYPSTSNPEEYNDEYPKPMDIIFEDVEQHKEHKPKPHHAKKRKGYEY